MLPNDYRSNPLYVDRYQRSSNWVRVLPVEGRALQASDLIEMQSIYLDNLTKALTPLYRSGSVLDGLRLLQQDGIYLVTPGSIFFEGVVLDVPGITLGDLSTGTHSIAIAIAESILTERDDINLRNPTYGSQYGLEGAHRLVWKASITLSPTANDFALAQVIEGNIIQAPLDTLRGLQDLLAQQTYDRAGNFLVSGFSVAYARSIQPSLRPSDDQKVIILQQQLSELSQALTQGNDELKRLGLDLDKARANYAIDPIPSKQAVIAGIELAIQQQAVSVSYLQGQVKSLTSQIDGVKGLVSLSDIFSISPGVAYVMGYRVNMPYITHLTIPREAYRREVISSRFTYQAPIAQTVRTFSLSTISSTHELSLAIYGLGDIPVLNIHLLSDRQTVTALLEDLVTGIRQGGLGVSLSDSGSNSQDTLRTHLNATLEFSSQGSTLIVRLIRSTGASLIRLQVTPTTPLTVDVLDGYLLAPGGVLAVNSYRLGMRPVAAITRVVADLEVSYLSLTRTSSSRDALGDDTVLQIVKVQQGNTIYVQGRDYYLEDQQWINWSLSSPTSIRPETGSTYYVSYRYTQPLQPDVDYRLVNDAVEFIGNTPYPNGTFTVDYDYYLSQIATIYLTRTGALGYIISPPAPTPVVPVVNSQWLALANVLLSAGSPTITQLAQPRLPLQGVQDLVRDYQQLYMDLEALKRSLSSSNYRLNLKINPIALMDPVASTVAKIGFPADMLTVPCNMVCVPLRYQGGGNLQQAYPFAITSSLTLPLTSRDRQVLPPLGLTQERATKYYSLSESPLPRLYTSIPYYFSTYRGALQTLPGAVDPISKEAMSLAISQGNALPNQVEASIATPYQVRLLVYGLRPDQSYYLSVDGTKTPATLLRARLTTLGFRPPIAGPLEILVDVSLVAGTHLVEIMPVGGASVPTASTVISVYDSREVPLLGSPALVDEPPILARGDGLDLLSQEFQVSYPMMVILAKLRLRTISPDLEMAILIKEGNRVLMGGTASSYSPSIRGDATTQFDLSEPLLLQPSRIYSLCPYIIKGSAEVFCARLGEKDINGDKAYVAGYQLYGGGSLTLPGGITQDDEDLSYEVEEAYFYMQPTTVLLGTYGLVDLIQGITALCINTRDVVPAGTSITYEYQLDSSTNWVALVANTYQPLPVLANQVSLRATLYTSIANLSPRLNLAGSTLSLYSNQASGYYRSTPIPAPNAIYSFLDVVVQWKGQGTLAVNFLHPTTLAKKPMSLRGTPTWDTDWVEETYTIPVGRQDLLYEVILTANNLSQPPVIRSIRYVLR